MSHKNRVDGPGLVHHITARVNWREWHFADDSAKRNLARLIREAAEEFGVDVLAGVLMSNHLHLVVRSPTGRLYRRLTSRYTACRHYRPLPAGHQKSTVIAQFMRSVRQRMTIGRQAELGLSGRFWEGRYDAKPIQDSTSLIVRMAYDHRNPVQQGMVALPEEYAWSTAGTWSSGLATELEVIVHRSLPFELDQVTLRHRLLGMQDAGAERDGQQDRRVERALRRHRRS